MLRISAPRRVPAAYLPLYELLTLRAAYLVELNQGIYDTLRAAHLGGLNQGLSSILTFVRPNKRNDSRRRHSLVRRSCCLRCSTSFLREIGYCILSQTLEWIGWHLSYNTLEWYIYIIYFEVYIMRLRKTRSTRDRSVTQLASMSSDEISYLTADGSC